MQLIDGARGLISIFSARQPSRKGEIPAPLFPDPLPEGAAYQALIHRVMENEILRGKLLSEDGQLTLVVLALDPSVVESKGLSDTVGEIRKTMGEDLTGLGLNAELSGVPVMQLEIRTAVERDRLLYNPVGFTAGCLIAILFFRRVSFMVIAAGPPLIAIVLALGSTRLARFPPQYVPQRDDAAHHGDQLFRQYAADLRHARPLAHGPRQIRGLEKCDFDRRTGLRFNPCDGGSVLHGLAVFNVGSDSQHLARPA